MKGEVQGRPSIAPQGLPFWLVGCDNGMTADGTNRCRSLVGQKRASVGMTTKCKDKTKSEERSFTSFRMTTKGRGALDAATPIP